MPLYEYECLKCRRRTEKIETVAGPHLKKCPHCGGKVEPVITAPAIQFKGSGWYVTDYAGKSPAGESAAADTAPAGGKDSKDTKDASGKGASSKSAKESTKKEAAKKKD